MGSVGQIKKIRIESYASAVSMRATFSALCNGRKTSQAGVEEADEDGVTARRRAFAPRADKGGSKLPFSTRLPPRTVSSQGTYAEPLPRAR